MLKLDHWLPPARAPLPEADPISLTQALTWILSGKPRTDRELEEDRDIQVKRNVADWMSPDGPEWLKPILEGSDNKGSSKVGAKSASKWLKHRNISLEAGLQLVRDALAVKVRAKEREQVCYRLLFTGCAKDHFTLYGLRHRDQSTTDHASHEPIPRSYFMRNPQFVPGKGYYGHGELSSVPPTEELLESAFSRSVEADRSPVYLKVMIGREDAELLRSEVDDELRALAHQEIENDVRECKISPVQGEAECRRLGLPPLNPELEPSAFDPDELNDWSFVMTIAWIASRDLQVVRRYMDAYVAQTTYWKELRTPDPEHPGRSRRTMHLLPSPRAHGTFFDLHIAASLDGAVKMTPDTAKAELWRKLQEGILFADAIDAATGKRIEIPSREFKDLQIISNSRREDHLASTATPTSFLEPAYFKPLLRRKDVLRVWPSGEGATVGSPIGTEPVDGTTDFRSTTMETARTRASFRKIEKAIQAEEQANGTPLPPLAPGERRARLSARMKAQGLKASEIPSERTFRDYFNKGPGKSAKDG